MILLALLTMMVTLIESTWQPLFLIKGVSPNLLLVWVICLSILLPRDSLKVAFGAGLFKDFLVGGVWGMHASGLVIISGLTILLKERIFQYKPLTWLVLLTLSTLSYPFLVTWLLSELEANFLRLLYNGVIFIAMMAILSRILVLFERGRA